MPLFIHHHTFHFQQRILHKKGSIRFKHHTHVSERITCFLTKWNNNFVIGGCIWKDEEVVVVSNCRKVFSKLRTSLEGRKIGNCRGSIHGKWVIRLIRSRKYHHPRKFCSDSIFGFADFLRVFQPIASHME